MCFASAAHTLPESLNQHTASAFRLISNTERMQASEFTELEAPAFFHSEKAEGAIMLGRVLFRDDRRSVVLALEDRRRHLYVVGKTGMGKSTLIQIMIVADVRAGRGICVVGPPHCGSTLRSENSRHRASGHIGKRTT